MITFPKQKTVETNRTFRAWKTYHGMYLHFTGSYDYFKYFGNAPWGTISSMEKYFAKFEHKTGFSWQRGFFTSLGKKMTKEFDLIYYYLSQLTRGKNYPSEFLDDYYDEYRIKMDSFSLHFQRNIKVIVEYLREYNLQFREVNIHHRPHKDANNYPKPNSNTKCLLCFSNFVRIFRPQTEFIRTY